MPTLPQRLFDGLAAAMAKLRQFGAAGGDFMQGAARACNGASQMVYQHPWGSASHALAVTFLPAFVGDLFGANGVPHCHDLRHYSPIHALPVVGQLSLSPY